jgi:hypothetical protein
MTRFLSTATVLLTFGVLGGCDDSGVRSRTYYVEVGCTGQFFTKESDGYKCNDEWVDLKKTTNYVPHTFVVNRRTGNVALDGQLLSESRVVDFDNWEGVVRINGGDFDIIDRYSSRPDGGYVEKICSASKPGAPEDYCQNLRYFGIPDSSDIQGFLRYKFCPTKSSYPFCRFL